MKRQVIAMGGGGFSMEAENPLLDQYILNASQLERTKSNFKLAESLKDRSRHGIWESNPT